MIENLPRRLAGRASDTNTKCNKIYRILPQFVSDASKLHPLQLAKIMWHLKKDKCPRCSKHLLDLVISKN